MKRSESIKNLALALMSAQSKLQKAVKNSQNPHFKSSFANLEAVWDACREPLNSSGLSVSQLLGTTDDGKTCLTTILMHSSGEWLEDCVNLPVTKTGPQEIGSCVSYMKRYALSALVGLSDTDDDGELAEGRNFEKERAARTFSQSSNTPVTPQTKIDPGPNKSVLSEKQINRLYAIAKSRNWTREEVDHHLKKSFNLTAFKMDRKQYEEACEYFSEIYFNPGLVYQPNIESGALSKIVAQKFDSNDEMPNFGEI